MSAGRTVHVNVEPYAYDVTVSAGSLNSAGEMFQSLSNSAKACVVSDSIVASSHGPALKQSLKSANVEVVEAILPAGEEHKDLASLMPIFDAFLRAKIDRDTPVIALGGGVVGDMAGFVAATLLRGVPFIQVPTTLLAMVDASVGGKTGVNHSAGKNLIGAFHQPIAVWIDPLTLKSLPARELRGGLAECIKHQIIRDADGFAKLEANIDRALSLDFEFLTEHIAQNVAIKARVVEADPFERGERAHLNFGHTIGHAIESVSKYAYSHGESVALGMCAAAYVATRLKLLDDASRQRIVTLIANAGLPTSGLQFDAAEIEDKTRFDKKVKSGRLRFVLPDRIGHVVIRDNVPTDLVLESIQQLQG